MDREENLIRAVEKRPVLYDLSHKLYRNNGYRRIIWKEVSDEIGVQIDECQKMWKRLREKFTNHRRKPRSGSAAVSQFMPPCIKSMQFLIPFMAYPEDCLASSFTSETEPISSDDSTLQSFFSSFTPTDGTNNDFTVFNETPIPNSSTPLRPSLPHTLPSTEETSCSTGSSTPRTNKRPSYSSARSTKRARHTENDADIDKIISAIQTPVEEYDEVDLFCLSATKDIKKMVPNEQRRIRFEISKLLLNASYEQ